MTWLRVAVIASALSLGAAAQAAPQCLDLYKPQPSRIEKVVEAITEPFKALKRPQEYNPEMITALKARFVTELQNGRTPDPTKMTNVNEKVAFLDAIAELNGRDLFQLNLWVQQAPPHLLARFTKVMRTFDFEHKTSWSKSEKAMVKIFMLTHFDPAEKGVWQTMSRAGWNPLKFAQLTKSEWGSDVLELQKYRVGISIARNGVLNGLEASGIVRDKTALNRLKLRLRPYMRPIDIVGSTLKTILAMRFPLLSTRTPRVLMTAKDMSKELEHRYLTEGFDAVRSEIQALYGRSAKVQMTLNRTEQFLGAILTPLMIAIMADDLFDLSKVLYEVVTGKEVNEKKIVLTVKERESRIDNALEHQRKLRIELTDPGPLGETEDEKAMRIEQIDAELRDYESELRTLTDNELVVSTGGES